MPGAECEDHGLTTRIESAGGNLERNIGIVAQATFAKEKQRELLPSRYRWCGREINMGEQSGGHEQRDACSGNRSACQHVRSRKASQCCRNFDERVIQRAPQTPGVESDIRAYQLSRDTDCKGLTVTRAIRYRLDRGYKN